MLKHLKQLWGQGKSKKPKSPPPPAPDNLFADDSFEYVIALSEGPIVGPEDGEKSIFLNSTALKNDRGEWNYQIARVETRPGVLDQAPLPMVLGGASKTINVNITLDTGLPVVRSTESGDIDQIEIRIVTNALYQASKPENASIGVTVRVELRVVGGSWQSWNLSWSGKVTGSPYVREYRINLNRANNPEKKIYDVRVTLLDSANGDVIRKISWESIQENNTSVSSYPNTALLYLHGRASDQISSIPEIAAICKGRMVQIPTNYDPVTRVYTGVWDGSFKIDWTNNPIWCLHDLLVNNRYGLSAFDPSLRVNRWDCYEAAQYCDEMVTSEYNTTPEPRYTFNGTIADGRTAIEQITYMAGVCNAVVWDDYFGEIRIRIDKPEHPVAAFTRENVYQGAFTYSTTGLETRYNEVTVEFTDPEQGWTGNRVIYKDQAHIDKYGRITDSVIFHGCRSRSMAYRKAKYVVENSINNTLMVRFETNRKGLNVGIFDTIVIGDEDMAWGLTARIYRYSIDRTIIYLREPIWLEAGITYEVIIEGYNGIEDYDIAGGQVGWVDRITLTKPLRSTIPDFAAFTLSDANGTYGAPKAFRVLGVTEVDGHPDRVTINAVETDRSLWTRVEKIIPVGDGTIRTPPPEPEPEEEDEDTGVSNVTPDTWPPILPLGRGDIYMAVNDSTEAVEVHFKPTFPTTFADYSGTFEVWGKKVEENNYYPIDVSLVGSGHYVWSGIEPSSYGDYIFRFLPWDTHSRRLKLQDAPDEEFEVRLCMANLGGIPPINYIGIFASKGQESGRFGSLMTITLETTFGNNPGQVNGALWDHYELEVTGPGGFSYTNYNMTGLSDSFYFTREGQYYFRACSVDICGAKSVVKTQDTNIAHPVVFPIGGTILLHRDVPTPPGFIDRPDITVGDENLFRWITRVTN